jgi:CSLREA domain-containing protein
MRMNARLTVLVAAMCVGLPASGMAANFVVNSTGNQSDNNAGNGVCRISNNNTQCTLRAAIQEANATTAMDTITFAIDSGPQRITLTSSLPTITRPVVIDGWTQPGFAGTPLIEVRGDSGYGDGFKLSGGNSTVRGLIINGFGGDGIILTGSTGNNVIEGNYIGTNADGSAPVPNEETGIRIQSPNNRIGGREVSQRNVVSGNTGRDIMGGIMVYGQSASGNIIQGNYIGLDATGMLPMGNEGRGVAIHDSSNNYVGGAQPGAGNLIAANRATGVRIWGGASTGNVVQGNWLGINKLGEMKYGLWPEPGTLSNARGVQSRGDGNYIMDNFILGNTWDGVLFYDGTEKDFDPTSKSSNNVVYHNVIAYNGLNGIGAYVGRRNWFISNSIFDNTRLGIELGKKALDGVQENDPGDGDSGANDLQNYPVLTSATVSGAQTVVLGTLNSKPNKAYHVQLFADLYCDAVGNGEAKY